MFFSRYGSWIMNKTLLLLVLTQVGLTTLRAEEAPMSFVMSLEYDLDSLLDSIRSLESYADMALEEVTKMGDQVPLKAGQLKASLSQDDEYVNISFNIPGLDLNKLDVEVEGKTLKGSIPLGEQTVNIEVTDGVLMISSHVTLDEKTGDDGEKRQCYEHSSTQMMSLPARVARLEDTELEYDNNQLVFKLPKFKEQKSATRKLAVTVK